MLRELIVKLTGTASYRRPMVVSERYLFRNKSTYPVCPRCKRTIEREYQSYCDRCGQALDWEKFDKALIIIK